MITCNDVSHWTGVLTVEGPGPGLAPSLIGYLVVVILLLRENPQAVAYSAQPLCWSD